MLESAYLRKLDQDIIVCDKEYQVQSMLSILVGELNQFAVMQMKRFDKFMEPRDGRVRRDLSMLYLRLDT